VRFLNNKEIIMPRVQAGPVYQLKITLRDFRPPIWRRVLVAGHYTLADLHYVIQFAMGWMDSHLHHFEVSGTHYSLPLRGTDWEDGGEVDSRPVRLDGIAPQVKTKFLYLYDFGDSWEHDVLVEKISPPDPKMKSPACLAGKGACPPEDVGGVWGYAEFLQAIKDPEHPEHDEYLEWVGDEFDPKAFDLEAVNKALKRLK